MGKDLIAAFIEQVRKRHGAEIDAINLPEGVEAFMRERLEAGDLDTIVFMLKLSHMMGLQTGYAARAAEEALPKDGSWGAIKA
jgi:hypothetical protein